MSGKLLFLAGLAVGFVVGARQGRGAYERLKARASDLWGDPKVQRGVSRAQETIRDRVPVVGDKVADAVDAAKPGEA